MKRLLLIVCVVALASCDKQTCWTCVTQNITTYSDGRRPDTTSLSQSICDYTAAEIEEHEKAGASEVTITSGGVTIMMRSQTLCGR